MAHIQRILFTDLEKKSSFEMALKLGIITNELITNSMKYVFPNGKGSTNISISEDEMDNAKILIVEDERIPAEYLKAILEQAGYSVAGICDRGAKAIEVTRETKPDLILMDIILKDSISGSEAALKISTFSDAIIIFLTAHVDREMVEYAMDSGAANYLIKPYREEQILTTIELALANRARDQRSGVVQERLELCDGYSYDLRTKQLYRNGVEVQLPKKKHKLLETLCKNIHIPVSGLELAREIYGKSGSEGALRTLVSRFNKLTGLSMVENVSMVGYKICTPEKTENES